MGRHDDESTHVNAHGGKQSKLTTRFDLLPPTAMRRVAEVFASGAEKYGEDNWRKITTKEHLAHALAHAYAWLEDEIDGEVSIEDHLVNLACRALMAIEIRDCGLDVEGEPGVLGPEWKDLGYTTDVSPGSMFHDAHPFRPSPWEQYGRGMWMAPVGTPEPPPRTPVQDHINIVRDRNAEVQREVQINWGNRSGG